MPDWEGNSSALSPESVSHLLVGRTPLGAHECKGDRCHVVLVGWQVTRPPGVPDEIRDAHDAFPQGSPQLDLPAPLGFEGQARWLGGQPAQFVGAGARVPLHRTAPPAHTTGYRGLRGWGKSTKADNTHANVEGAGPIRGSCTSRVAGQAARRCLSTCTQRSSIPLRGRNPARQQVSMRISSSSSHRVRAVDRPNLALSASKQTQVVLSCLEMSAVPKHCKKPCMISGDIWLGRGIT